MDYKYNLLKKKIDRRSFVLIFFKFSLISIIVVKNFFLQLLNQEKYSNLSENNRIKFTLLPSLRGEIFDKFSQGLALNSDRFNLALINRDLSQLRAEILLIKKIFKWNDDFCTKILSEIKKIPKYGQKIIKSNISWEHVSFLEENKELLVNFFIDIENARIYPYEKFLFHTVGYLQRGFQDQYSQNLKNINIGKFGLEKFYHNQLKGVDGYKKIEKDAFGKLNKVIKISNIIKGSDIFTNLDAKLQKDFFDLIPDMSGSVVVNECSTGNILSMISFPSFDPHSMVNLSHKEWSNINSDPEHPLLNKSVQSSYPPGSVFKIVTMLAALESGISIDQKFECKGFIWIGGRRFGCAKKSGHGLINMSEALQFSCNCYMYNIAKIIGHQKILDAAQELGLGKKTGIDLPDEKEGFLPSVEWKYKKFGQKWMLGDSLNLAIGQGFTLVTPIQLSMLISAIANGGFLYQPNIAKRTIKSRQLGFSLDNLKLVKDALYKAINEIGGTGYYRSRFNFNSMTMSGKTGTAQLIQKKSLEEDFDDLKNTEHKKRNHSIFVGFAPSSEPKFSVSLYCSNMGSGSRFAAPLARSIMLRLLKKYFSIL
ncbi:MAG: penicillin-binding protein 2 [Rickettsia sp.]|nr:penicillin-binding protein 2 [Rickettsia sp.]